jgi:hypothetical protein
MTRFPQQFDPGQTANAAERDRMLGEPTVHELMNELERGRQNPQAK